MGLGVYFCILSTCSVEWNEVSVRNRAAHENAEIEFMEEIVRGQATLENLSPPLDSHTSLTTSASCQSGHDALPNIPHKYICLTACFMAKRTESMVFMKILRDRKRSKTWSDWQDRSSTLSFIKVWTNTWLFHKVHIICLEAGCVDAPASSLWGLQNIKYFKAR